MKKYLSLFLLLVLFSVTLNAVSFMEGRIVFDIPDALEVRSDQFEQIFSRVVDDAGYDFMNNYGEDTFKVVLQQKGLNTGNSKANTQYCRVTIEVSTDDSSSIPNQLIRDTVSSLAQSEKAEYENMMRRITENSVAVIDWYPTTYRDLGGLFAICNHYTRKSTSGNESPVEAYSYNIQADIYTITIFCSYRKSQASIFATAIDEFLESFTFKASDNTGQLSSLFATNGLHVHTIPETDIRFTWPESNPTWKVLDENSMAKVRQLVYSDLFGEGYLCTLTILEYKIDLSSYQTSTLLAATLNEGLSLLRMNTNLKNLKLLEQSMDNNSARLRYSYTNRVDDSTAYGFGYWLTMNKRSIIALSAEYSSGCGDTPEAVLHSLQAFMEQFAFSLK